MKLSKPNGKRSFWHKKGLWAVLLALLLAGGGAAYYFLGLANTAQASSAGQATTATTTVKRGSLTVGATGSGTLTVGTSVDLSFRAGGTVSGVYVKLGEMVTAGQKLAEVGNAATLEANVTNVKLQLLQANQTLTDLQEGASVSLAQAYQTWVQAKGDYEEALAANQRLDYTRCSQEVRTRYQAALDLATARLEEVSKRYSGTQAWTEAKNNYEQAVLNLNSCAYSASDKVKANATLQVAKSELDRAERDYQELETSSGIDPDEIALYEAKINNLKTQLASAEEDLAGTLLTAPSDGKIVYLGASAGAIVNTDKFITIADVSQPQVIFNADETDMDKLVIGNKATVVLDALPDVTFNGEIIRVEPELISSGPYKVLQGVIALDAEAAKTTAQLPLGLSATVSIISEEVDNVLVVPQTALNKANDGAYSVLLKQGSQFVSTAVTVGLMDSTNAEIVSGLNEGDVISASGGKDVSASSQTDMGGMPGGGMPPMGGPGMP